MDPSSRAGNEPRSEAADGAQSAAAADVAAAGTVVNVLSQNVWCHYLVGGGQMRLRMDIFAKAVQHTRPAVDIVFVQV